MNRSLFRKLTYLQLALSLFMATGCTPTQPFFLNESPDLQYYLNTATQIEYPDVEVDSLAETTEAYAPLTMGNHEYQFWDLTVEDCVSIALQNAKFFVTTSGNAETRQNVAAQFTSASVEQIGSIYDIPIAQSTTQSVPLTVDGSGNRTLPRGVLRANQVGGVEDALAEFDAQASAFVNFSTTDRPRNVGETAVSTSISQGTDVTQQAALSKRFVTGGVATLRQQIIYDRSNLQTGEVNQASRLNTSAYLFTLEAQVQHPLMRNRGTLINRIPVVLASLNEDIAITDFEIQVRNLVRDVEVAYWNLYVAYRAVSTTIIGRNSAEATAHFARLNKENGTGTIQEVAQADGQYYGFRLQLETALSPSNLPGADQRGVYGRERDLRELLGIASTDGRLIRPIQEPSLARIEFDWDEIVSQMLYLSPELRRGRTVIKQRELEQMSAKNQLLPEVNLSLLYRWVGQGDTFGPPERSSVPSPFPGSSALADFTGGGNQEGSIRLEINPSAIGGRRERARIRGSQLRLHQSRMFLQEAERLLVSQLADAISKTATHYQAIQTSALAWQAAEVEVDARIAEYEGGRSPVNIVLESQRRKADAQIGYYRALSEYNKSLNYVDYLKGTMLANSSISLREGTWNKKAYWDALERARERSAGRKVKYGVSRPSVVRRGPVANAETASQYVGDSDMNAAMMPPGVDVPSNMILEGANVYSERGIIQPPSDTPLTELGNSTLELLSPGTTDLESPAGIPTPVPDQMPNAINNVLPNRTDMTPGANSRIIQGGQVSPMAYTEESTMTSERQRTRTDASTVSSQAIGSGLQNEIHYGSAPTPVRRKSVPIN